MRNFETRRWEAIVKVLIIEDELLIAVELDRIVEAAGHEIVSVVAPSIRHWLMLRAPR